MTAFVLYENLPIKIISLPFEISLITIFYLLSFVYILLLYINKDELNVFIIVLYFLSIFIYLYISIYIKLTWLLGLILLPLTYFIFRKKGKTFSVIVTICINVIIIAFYLIIVMFTMFFGNLRYVKEEVYYSPDKDYVAISYINDSGALGGEEWVNLYENTSALFVVYKSQLYFDGNFKEDLDVKWIDYNTIYIEGNYVSINELEDN